MNRSTLDKLISSMGLVVAVVLLLSAYGLFYTSNYVHQQVKDQLSSQKIFFPASGSAQISALPAADQAKVAQYAGQQLLTGQQAEVYADHFIAIHLVGIGGGQTYSQLSAAAIANPSDPALAAKVQLMFRGETLRGLLLNAYAFDKVATIAYDAAVGALIAGVVLLVLSLMGFYHSGRVNKKSTRGKKK